MARTTPPRAAKGKRPANGTVIASVRSLDDAVELTATVVTPRRLYRMKKDTVRLKDRADAELLRRKFRLEDE